MRERLLVAHKSASVLEETLRAHSNKSRRLLNQNLARSANGYYGPEGANGERPLFSEADIYNFGAGLPVPNATLFNLWRNTNAELRSDPFPAFKVLRKPAGPRGFHHGVIELGGAAWLRRRG